MARRHLLSKYLYPPSAACEEKVDSYINELNSSYTQIEGWLPESATSDRTNTLFEYWDGHYDAPAMNIRYGDLDLRLVPAGINLGGSALVYYVVNPLNRDSSTREAHIIKGDNDALWFEVRKAGDSSPKRYPFDRKSFADFLDEIVAFS
jgi:hypothetical protein